jgi:small-conductance mechanosensitive channel
MKNTRFWATFFFIFSFTVTAFADPSSGLPSPEPPIDRSTPRRSVDAFLRACRDGDYARAAYMLDLRSIPSRDHATEGALLARQLKLVFDAALWVDLDAVSDSPAGLESDESATDTLGTIRIGVIDQPIQLRRTNLANNEQVWVFSTRTIQAIPMLYDELGPGLLGERMPPFLTKSAVLGIELWQWLGLAIALAVALLIGRTFSDLVLRAILRMGIDVHEMVDPHVIERLRTPTRFTVGLVTYYMLVVALHLTPPARALFGSVWKGCLAIAVAFYAFRLIDLIASSIEQRAASTQGADSSHARGIKTQARVLRRVLHVLTAIVGGALVLMQFAIVRSFGVSILAASGAAGLVLGLAAQRSLGAFFAGIQLSFTQPIRIGDTVVVEKEFGVVEEITLSYVVIKTWDQRRFIVPIVHFLEKPFENWTRVSEELLGTVEIYCDYTVPVDRVRQQLQTYLETNALWDRKIVKLQVRDATERSIMLRAVMSASTPDNVFDLRNEVREHLTRFLQELEGGRFLPRARVADKATDLDQDALTNARTQQS